MASIETKAAFHPTATCSKCGCGMVRPMIQGEVDGLNWPYACSHAIQEGLSGHDTIAHDRATTDPWWRRARERRSIA